MVQAIAWLRVAAGVVVMAAATGCSKTTTSSGASTSPSSPAPAATVTIVSDPATIGRFTPPTVTVAPGQSVEWVFQDLNPHTVTADDSSFTSVQTGLTKGQTYAHAFAQAGTYAYHCFIHPQMKAAVVVQ
jgi:plastocyanin